MRKERSRVSFCTPHGNRNIRVGVGIRGQGTERREVNLPETTALKVMEEARQTPPEERQIGKHPDHGPGQGYDPALVFGSVA